MAAKKGRKRARKPRPEERIDDLIIEIGEVCRRWSRNRRWDVLGKLATGYESSDQLELTGKVRHPSRLEAERVQLTVYSRPKTDEDEGSLGYCDRVRGERTVLNAVAWLPQDDLLALAPEIVAGRLVESELRVKGFFRGKGRIYEVTFSSRLTPAEELPEE